MQEFKITKKFFDLKDLDYAAFQSKLTPGIPPEHFIGIRMPLMRKLAKEYIKDPECVQFLNRLPHKYYEENMLHGLLIEQIRDYDECIKQLDIFLPYVDNWAVCDVMSPKVFKRNTNRLIDDINRWIASRHTYTIRFGIGMLMRYYLEDLFKPEYLSLVASVRSDEYYVKMMIAWFFATALAKQYEKTVPYIESKVLDDWTHRKTIQKACESYRISDEQKKYLKTLK
ncbi:MAG: DNA alkylation repair protein [Acutalibacteraceae bacterium]|jgi:3-methyladenine DNA glycosylase AlkD